MKPSDNLKPEGDFYTPDKKSVKPAEKRTPFRHDDNLRPEGQFERPEKTQFVPAERPQQTRPVDSFPKPTGMLCVFVALRSKVFPHSVFQNLANIVRRFP